MIRHASALLALLAVTPALAGPREDVYSASLRCSALADDRGWLECYYGAAQPMRGQLQLQPAPASQTALIPPPIPGPAASGRPASIPAPQASGPVSRATDFLLGGGVVVSRVAIQSYTPGGNFSVTLANGQTWRQDDDQTRLVRWRDGPQAHRVTIWKGALNTFNLAFDGEADRYKVRQVK